MLMTVKSGQEAFQRSPISCLS
uniref:Uncharacterized protein n=1 Tax=Anguilla anguilla TaxID=7936 RepID=A0A0E9R3S6_ANGAN